MKIAIITRGRMNNVRTMDSIPRDWLSQTYIICPHEEVFSHEKRYPSAKIIPEGPRTLNYSEKFHAIVGGHYPELGRRILIIDDDIRYSVRNPQNPKSLVTAYENEISNAFKVLETMMEDYPLVGLHPRAMGNNAPIGIKECTRINAMQGVNLDLIGPIKLDLWPILADMVLNLSLLMRGQKTAIFCNLFWDQVGASNAPGGCSLHRTAEQQAQAVYGLAGMFPDVVTVTEKEVKKGWFGGKRVDFRIQWQKAYKLGVEHAKGIH